MNSMFETNKPKVSIVLPVHNGEKFLHDSIESVLRQTHKNLELIIVDDKSTDSSFEIMQEYARIDKRVTVIQNEINLKLPNALNVGFAQARGEYFTWTSDDNYYEENAIERMLSFLEENIEYSMVYCRFTKIDERGDVVKMIHNPEPNNLLYGNCVGACFLYTKEIALKVGKYNSHFFLVEDFEYWIRIYCNGKIAHLRENLYFYRLHNDSLTTKQKNNIHKQEIEMYYYHWKMIYPLISEISATKLLGRLNDIADSTAQEKVKEMNLEVIKFWENTIVDKDTLYES